MTAPLLPRREDLAKELAGDTEGLSPNSQIRQQKTASAAAELHQEEAKDSESKDATAPGGGGYPSEPAPETTDTSLAQAVARKNPECLPVIKEHHKAVADQVSNFVKNAEPTLLFTTVNKILPCIQTEDDLEAVVTCIFKMVMDDKMDGHGMRCGETFADITSSLRSVVRSFPVPAGAPVGTKAMTFTRMLLNVTQDTFEARSNEFKNTEALNDSGGLLDKVGDCLTALVAFIGHQFVRKLIAQRVLAQVVHELIGVRDKQPDKRLILCACELMQVIGRAIDETKQGTMLMTQFLARLSNLAALRKKDSTQATYPQEIRDAIRAVHEARFLQWPARGGSQMLVQYHEVPLEAAKTTFETLDTDRALPPHRKDAPTVEDTASDLVHLEICAVISGNPIAVIFSKTQAELTELVLKDEISHLTGVHAERLMVFKPDLTLLEDDIKARARQ